MYGRLERAQTGPVRLINEVDLSTYKGTVACLCSSSIGPTEIIFGPEEETGFRHILRREHGFHETAYIECIGKLKKDGDIRRGFMLNNATIKQIYVLESGR